ncbi:MULTISPECIES: hypothetical protein [unclassified Sphingomonas]|uniref:hypothetical protein n=1 Tax=unclassified Sphingomonas TaxID=196159 RepID=UPI0006F940D2|nr:MULTISPECIES: hypothetical protein [unclassified Sphingomonas]KQM58892.1 hypothetical protein ASE65_11095 [Sphingomonas sp. Leaf16]KQN11147.1 hypothetical protein ASE81_12085 [Sphingomonas sp. Leaf29]KQN18446.1 hypothetical protein ASE83_12010 [Sphingomonas sp. Leaf32]
MTRERRRAAILMAGIGLTLSLLCGWLLAGSITASLAAWHGGAAEVRVSGGDVGMLVLMPILIALAAWGTMAAFRDGSAMRRIGNGIAVAAMIAVPVALAGSWAFQAWAEQRLVQDGYVRCGADRTGRFPSLTLCARKAIPA